MKFRNDKSGSKFLLLTILILICYLALFKFDIERAYRFTITQNVQVLHDYFGL